MADLAVDLAAFSLILLQSDFIDCRPDWIAIGLGLGPNCDQTVTQVSKLPERAVWHVPHKIWSRQ